MKIGKLVCAAAMAACFSVPAVAQESVDDTGLTATEHPFLQEVNEVFHADYSYTAPNDVDGDGLSDLLWVNADRGLVGYWLSTWDYSPTPTYVRGPTKVFHVKPGYHVGAVGDLNGDRKADLVFTNAHRDLELWTSNGTTFDVSHIGHYPEGWRLLGAGDVDGDNNADLLWWNEKKCLFGYWRMQGAAVVEKQTVKAPCGYHVAAIGHFMQTFNLDLIWTSDAHDVLLWAGSPTGFTSTILGNYDPQGHIVGAAIAGDFGGINVYVKNDTQPQFTQYEWIRYYDSQGNVGQTTFNAVRSLPLNPGDYLGATGNFDGYDEAVLVWANDKAATAPPSTPGQLTWYVNTVTWPSQVGWQSATIANYRSGWRLLGARH